MSDCNLIGDPTHGVEELARRLEQEGLRAETQPAAMNSSSLLFVVSALEGPTVDGLEMARRWNGSPMRFLGIVFTGIEAGADSELVELVYLETKTRLVAEEVKVPFFFAEDPQLAKALKERLSTAPTVTMLVNVTVAPVDGQDHRFDLGEQRGKGKRPWWQFW